MSPQPYKPQILEGTAYSFDLHADMVKSLAEEFNGRAVVQQFAAAGDPAVFAAYGQALARRCLELGREYPDRTAEVLEGIFKRANGVYRFPLLPQRYLEIAYLSTFEVFTLPIESNNPSQLVYRMVDCAINRALREQCGESAAAAMPCRQACTALCEEINRGLGIAVNVAMQASMAADGVCQFAITPK